MAKHGENQSRNENFTEQSRAKVPMVSLEPLDSTLPLHFVSTGTIHSYYANIFLSLKHEFAFCHMAMKYSDLICHYHSINKEICYYLDRF